MLKPITITKTQCRFFYRNGRHFCSVHIPHAHTIYMDMGRDNRPFEAVVSDIQAATTLFLDSYSGDPYLREVSFGIALPSLLGYKRSNSMLS